MGVGCTHVLSSFCLLSTSAIGILNISIRQSAVRCSSTFPCSSSSKFYVTECSSGQAPSEVDSGGTSAEPQLGPVSISENFTVDPDAESEKENELRILREQMGKMQEEK
jgi:hypothetical protein